MLQTLPQASSAQVARPSVRRLVVLGLPMLWLPLPHTSLAATPVVGSQDAADAAPPLEVAEHLGAPVLVGQGQLRFFGLAIYNARLWAKEGFAASRFETHEFALELIYLRELNGAAIAERSVAEMRRHAEWNERQASAWLDAMKKVFPNVVSGDRLTGVNIPGAPVRFLLNGRQLGNIALPGFARLFFGIWLAESTSERALRQRLLGGAP